VGTKSKWKNGILRFYNNAVVDENVEELSAAPTTSYPAMRGYGLSVVSCTAAASRFTLGAPVPGVTKDITVGDGAGTSFTCTVRCSTVANAITIGSPGTPPKQTVVLTPGSTYPAYAQLRGVTTVLWVMTSFTTGKGGAALTTACT